MKGDKDSSVVILNKTDYIEKLENMVKEGIDKGTYTLTEDNTIKGYLRYKTIFCYKVAFDVWLMDFFIWRENDVSFPRYLGFCDFVKSAYLKICDVIIDIAS